MRKPQDIHVIVHYPTTYYGMLSYVRRVVYADPDLLYERIRKSKYNIDYWYRNAEGQMKHRYPLVISERQLICETYEDLLRIKRRMTFDELAPTTQEIICNQHPYFSRETLAEWNYFLWGELHDLEAMLELEPHPDEHLNKERFHSIVAEIRRQRYEFWLSIPDTPGLAIENCQVRIITWG